MDVGVRGGLSALRLLMRYASGRRIYFVLLDYGVNLSCLLYPIILAEEAP